VQPNGHLGLFFGADWELHSDRISYGHDIEAAWLLNDAVAAVGVAALAKRVHALTRRIAEITLAEGVDADGGIYNEGGPQGLTNTNKEWWPQTEAVVGFLDAYQQTNDDRFLRAAFAAWDFIERRLIDRSHGEWFRGVTRDGQLLTGEFKVSFWKCPYHNGRAALEATRRLRDIR
jgi:mannobiose 2-epimerase